MTPSKTLTGRLAAAFIDSKLTILVMIAALLFGLWSVMTTPREENPQITMPAAGVKVFLPGADPAEVEAKAVRPLESLINQIEGVDHVWSVSEDSQALVTVQFKVGEDKEASLVKLADRVMSGRNQLPADVVGPFIASADADDVPVLAVTFFSEKYGDDALQQVADRVADHLMGLENVSSLSVVGGRAREITADVDPAKLESFHLTMDSVKAAIAAANLAGPLGSITDANVVTRVRLANFIADAEDLKHLVVGVSPSGAAVHLSDVAVIRLISNNQWRKVSLKNEGAKSDLAQAEAMLAVARTQADYLTIRAEHDGHVAAVMKHAGDLALPGLPIAVIDTDANPKFEFHVPESVRSQLSVGQPVTVALDNAARLTGRIERLNESADRLTRSYLARATIDDSEGVRPGMYGKLAVRLGGAERPAAPKSALTERGGLTGVFVVEQGKALFHWVKLGKQTADAVEVLAGLSGGETLVESPSAMLYDGAAVTVKEAK